jgi:hypothetical protein
MSEGRPRLASPLLPCFAPSIPRDIGAVRARVKPINFQTETLPRLRSPTPDPPDHPGPPGRSPLHFDGDLRRTSSGRQSMRRVAPSAIVPTIMKRLAASNGAAPRISTEGRKRLSIPKGQPGTIGGPLPVLSPPCEALRVLPAMALCRAQRRQSEYPLARPSLIGVNGFGATAINGQRHADLRRVGAA